MSEWAKNRAFEAERERASLEANQEVVQSEIVEEQLYDGTTEPKTRDEMLFALEKFGIEHNPKASKAELQLVLEKFVKSTRTIATNQDGTPSTLEDVFGTKTKDET